MKEEMRTEAIKEIMNRIKANLAVFWEYVEYGNYSEGRDVHVQFGQPRITEINAPILTEARRHLAGMSVADLNFWTGGTPFGTRLLNRFVEAQINAVRTKVEEAYDEAYNA